jgi:hypothetical protein
MDCALNAIKQIKEGVSKWVQLKQN